MSQTSVFNEVINLLVICFKILHIVLIRILVIDIKICNNRHKTQPAPICRLKLGPISQTRSAGLYSTQEKKFYNNITVINSHPGPKYASECTYHSRGHSDTS